MSKFGGFSGLYCVYLGIQFNRNGSDHFMLVFVVGITMKYSFFKMMCIFVQYIAGEGKGHFGLLEEKFPAKA